MPGPRPSLPARSSVKALVALLVALFLSVLGPGPGAVDGFHPWAPDAHAHARTWSAPASLDVAAIHEGDAPGGAAAVPMSASHARTASAASAVPTSASHARTVSAVPTSASHARTASAAPTSASYARTVSALVRVAGGSVYDVFAQRAGPAVPAADVRSRAAKLAPVLRAAEVDVARRQAPVVRSAEALGITVVSRYTTAANGLLVHGAPEAIAALATAPGVVGIEPAPALRPTLGRSVPRVGAEAVAATYGFTGTGTVIAVLDSGIDYTHAAFGGPGDPAAYTAAAAGAERIDDSWEGRRLYPNDVVVGGWDFVGPNYTHPRLCPPEAEAAGRCTPTPHPDPDPIDQHGHGTHVAGAAAGRPAAGVYGGVAPGARLVALKVYGPPAEMADTDETIDVLIDAVDWCVRVNLGRDVPGVPPPAPGVINVINLSLGEPFGQGSRLVDDAFEAAGGAGIVVVTAAGNDNDVPYIVSSPGASPFALSVAAVALGDTDEADVMAGYSARGPSKNGALKPDLAAPGGVVSARMGSGVDGAFASGTSLATPHVAGAAALLFERDRVQGLDLTATDIAALLTTAARAMPVPDGAGSVPIVRQGAGRLAVERAVAAPIVVRSGDIASVNLSALSLQVAEPFRRTITVRNLRDQAVRVALPAPEFLHTDDRSAGLTLTVPEHQVVIPPKETVDIPVTLMVDPGALRPWTLRGPAPFDARVIDNLEIDGVIMVVATEAEGGATWSARVPFYALPRAASAVLDQTDPSGSLRFHNFADHAGTVELFVVPDGLRGGDPDEPDVLGELDIRDVGVRFEGEGAGAALAFGIALHDVSVLPQLTQLELYLDVDRDGMIDYRIRAGVPRPEAQEMEVAVGAWDDASGVPAGPERSVGTGIYDLHARTFVIGLPLSALGLARPSAFDFYVLHRALTEDWWGATQVDAVPDDYAGSCGRARLGVDPASWRNLPERWTVPVAGDATVEVPRGIGPGSRTPALLALLPENGFGAGSVQSDLIDQGADPEPPSTAGVCRAYMPQLSRSYEIRPRAAADVLFAQALDASAAQTWLRLVWDLEDKRDAAQSGSKHYRFHSPAGLNVIDWPRTGLDQYEYIRVTRNAYVRRVREQVPQENFHCSTVQPWMLFWPDWVTRFRAEFPSSGWQNQGPSSYYGHPTWYLKQATSDGRLAYSAQIEIATGLMLFMSRREFVAGAEVRADSYKLENYGERNIGMSPPRGLVCP